MSDCLQPHGLQHGRFPCPSPSPGVCSNSCPLSQWYPPTISSSVVPFSSCLQSFPASGSSLSQLFASGGQSIGASASVLPVNIQGWFPSGLTGLIFLQSKGLLKGFSSSYVWTWELDHKGGLSDKESMLLNCGAEEDFWESLGQQGDQTYRS